MNICYFGAWSPTYPRNQVLRLGLETRGVTITPCRVDKRLRMWQRIPRLVAAYARVWRDVDLLLVSEFDQSLVPLAWLLARLTGKPIITDLLISYFDMVVHVRHQASPRSLRGQYVFLLDWLGCHLADACLVDAPPHRAYFIDRFGAQPERIHVLPLGVNTAHFTPRPTPSHDGILVQYYGSFTPAHGVLTSIRAAALLREREDISFEYIGAGQDRAAAEALAESLGLTRVRFEDPIPYADLPARIATADICLGEFGDTPQTRQGLANKVFQTLAMGKALIAGDTPSIRSLFEPGRHMQLVPLEDPQALAQAIRTLADDPPVRERLGAAGQAHVLARFSPEALGGQLYDLVASLLPHGASS